MTKKQKEREALKEKILKRIDFLSEHWIMGDDKPPFSFGGWREEVAEDLVDIFNQALSQKVEVTSSGNPPTGTYFDQEQLKDEVRREVVGGINALIEKMKGEMYLYEHRPVDGHILGIVAKPDEEKYRAATNTTVCASCRDRVEVGSPCKHSKYYPVWVNLKMYVDILQSLTKTK